MHDLTLSEDEIYIAGIVGVLTIFIPLSPPRFVACYNPYVDRI